MHARTRLVGVLTALLATLSLCACSRPASVPPATSATSQTPTTSAEQTSTPDDDTPPRNETASQAATRLFPEVLDAASIEVDNAELLAGTRPGVPVPTTRAYFADRLLVMHWELPNDARRVSGGMFAAMRRAEVTKQVVLVPVTRNGRPIAEFPLLKNANGYWSTPGIAPGVLPEGEIAALEDAARKLRGVLGKNTTVRATVFVPSGLAFAVGNRDGREAAVFLRMVGHPSKIQRYKGRLPARGELFTSSQLQQLFSDANAERPPPRNPPGALN